MLKIHDLDSQINGCVSLKILPRSSHLGFSSERNSWGGEKKSFRRAIKTENKITKHFRNFRSQLKGFLVEELDFFPQHSLLLTALTFPGMRIFA